jgi:hypothetical protein
MFVATAILVIIALAAAYALLMPITVYIDFLIDGGTSRVAGFRIFPFGWNFKPGKSEHKPKILKPSIQQKKGGVDLAEVTIADLELLFSMLADLLRFLLGAVRSPDRYFVNAALAGGAGSPDITGQLYGMVRAMRPILPGSISLSYAPDFQSQRLHGRIECGFVVRIVMILRELVLLLLRLPKMKLLRLYMKHRKRGSHGKQQQVT